MISLRVGVVEQAAVQQVHPHDPDAFLLQADVRIVQAHVEDHIVGGLVRGRLWKRTPIQPCPLCGRSKVLPATVLAKVKNFLVGWSFAVQPFLHQAVLVPQHVLQPAFAYEAVARFAAVDGVAEVLVVGAHGLRNGLRSAASAEEMPHGFLPSTDLGEGAVEVRVHIDPPCLLRRAQRYTVGVLYDHEAGSEHMEGAKLAPPFCLVMSKVSVGAFSSRIWST